MGGDGSPLEMCEQESVRLSHSWHSGFCEDESMPVLLEELGEQMLKWDSVAPSWFTLAHC